jgi:pimeloyl-ACP methyl ester carboxylesterase
MPFLTRLTYAVLRRNRAWTRASLGSIFTNPSRISDDLANDVFAEIRQPAAGEAFMAFQRREMLPDRVRTNYLDRLHEIKAPTLFIHGDRDSLVPVAWAREANRRLAGSQLQVIPDCGHWPQRELPAAFHAIITEFLRD